MSTASEAIGQAAPKPKPIYRHIESSSVREKVNRTENKIIKGTINDNYDYFENKLKNILKERYIFSNQKIKHAFYDICLDNTSFHSDANPLDMIKKYVFTRTHNIQNDKEYAAELNEIVVDIFIRSLQADEPAITEKVLYWIVEDISKMEKIKPLIEKWFNDILSECVENENLDALNRILDGLGSQPNLQKEKYNTPPMIRACEKNNYEMILAFLFFGFTVDDTQFKTEKEVKNKRPLSVRLSSQAPKKSHQLEKFKQFCATSEPAYLLANFKVNQKAEDPISAAFLNAHIAKRQKLAKPEYRNKYNDILRKSERFIVSMLDLCRSTEEAVLFLSYDYNVDEYFHGKNEKSMVYPRLFLADEEHHQQFSTHDYSQQVLRNRWHQSDATLEIIPWQTFGKIGKMLYYLRTLVLLPLYMLCYLITIFYNRPKKEMSVDALDKLTEFQPYYDRDDYETHSKRRIVMDHLFNFFTYPFNRQQALIVTQFVFFFVCFSMTIRNPHKSLNHCDIIVISWAIGCIISKVNTLMDSPQTIGWKNWLKGHWGEIFEIVFIYFLMLVGYSMISLDSSSCPREGVKWKDWCSNENLEYEKHMNVSLEIGNLGKLAKLPEDSWPKIGYSILGFAFTINVVRIIVYWSRLNPWLGPVAISIKAVIADVIPIIIFHVMFWFTFALGLHYILGLSSFSDCEKTTCNYNVEEDDNKFRDLKLAVKTVLWSLFDPGHPEVVGCVQHGVPRYIGYFLWIIYNVINIIILMNLLIALMTNTINDIHKDRTMQWKFSRTSMWLHYFVIDCYLPPPFNILELIVKSINKARCLFICKKTDTEDGNGKPEAIKQRYNELVVKLAERYLHMEEDSEENDVTKEDLNNAKRDIIRSFKKIGSTLLVKKKQRIVSQYY